MSIRRGFTLIELVLVLVLLGVLATVAAALLRQPFEASAAVQRRARLADDAELAMARLSRDLRLALPNSVRIAADGQALELLRAPQGGRYRAQAGSSGGDPLDFGRADDGFDVLAGLDAAPVAGQWAVVYNLVASGVQANAWAGDNRATLGSGSTGGHLVLAPAFRFPYPSPQQRVYIVDGALQYRCSADGVLWRHGGYPPALAMQVPPASGDGERLLDGLSSCRFDYDPGAGSRNALVTLTLALTRDGESASLLKSVHLPNTP